MKPGGIVRNCAKLPAEDFRDVREIHVFFIVLTLMSQTSKKENQSVEVAETVARDDSPSLRHADDVRLAELGYKSEFKREFSVSL